MTKLFEKQKAWTSKEVRLLGKFTDAEISERTGRSVWAVVSKRRRLGIDAVIQQLGYNWESWEVALLGSMSDQQVADSLGISKRTVIRERQRRGIGPFTRH